MARVFERIEPLIGDLAVFGRGEKAGAVNRGGRTVLEPKFDVVAVLPGGMIWAADRNAGTDVALAGTLFDAAGAVLKREVPDPRPSESAAPPARPSQAVVVDTRLGKVLVGRDGKAISEPYQHIFVPLDRQQQSMLAVRGEKPNEQLFQLFLDGRPLPFPPGGSIDDFREGVATLRLTSVDGSGKSAQREGLIDSMGRVVMPAEFDAIRPAKNGWITFQRAGRWGVADTRGRIRVAPMLAWIDFQAHGNLFTASPADRRVGVIDADGRWVVPARFREIVWIDDTLIAAREDTLDAQGRADSRTLMFTADGRPWPGPPMRYAPTRAEFGLLLAYDLDPARGQNLLDRDGRIVARGVSGGNAFDLPDTPAGPFFVKKGSDFAVVAAYGGELSPRAFHQIHQQFRNGRAVADDALLNARGQVLATYASAAPPGAAWPDDLDERLESAVDPCFEADPIDPGRLPEPLRMTCADAALHALLRQAESRYMRQVEGLTGLPRRIERHALFQAAVMACSSAECVRPILEARLAALRSAPPAASYRPLSQYGKPGRVALALRRQLLKGGVEALADGAEVTWGHIDLRSDGHLQVLAQSHGGMRSFGVAIWNQEGGRWRLLLSDQVSDVQVLPRIERRAWPGLVVSHDGGAAGGDVSILRADAEGYRAVITCDQLWGIDGKESVSYLACDADKPWPQRRRSSQP